MMTSSSGKTAFSQRVGGMSDAEEDRFVLGKSFFRIPWVEAPSATTARDGLGPLFSANTCIHCHPGNGAGFATNAEGNLNRALVMRLSVPSAKNLNNESEVRTQGFAPEPNYGAQLSVSGVFGVPSEGRPSVTYEEIKGRYPDGTPYALRNPLYRIEELNYGPLHEGANIAPHIAPALVGLGALERISEESILAHADEEDRDKDGISGRANYVYSPETKGMMLGRYTWKAAAPTVRHQVANAMHNDMGLSTSLYSEENCTPSQKECNEAPRGRGEFDVPDARLDAVTYYVTSLRIPKQRRLEEGHRGRELFAQLGCAKCHVESYETTDGLTVHPYSDLLLHDMGEALSDGHADFRATPREWRTPPLWGAGLYQAVSGEANYLHDGRARSFEEAILWHGGEGEASKQAFMHLDRKERRMLIEFLGSI
jgi:CxxC motif-containing protein (DUF1111 family)